MRRPAAASYCRVDRWRTGGGRRVETDAELDRQLEAAQAVLLAEHAPDTRVRRVRWSQGETQVLELGTGPPLLFVHGALSGAAGWIPILPQLARSRRVLAVDLPGHGLSDRFDYQGVDLLQLAATFLRDILDALELRTVDVVANSMGGLFSVVFAIEHPKRVSRLILVGAPLGVDRAIPIQLRVLGIPLIGRPLARFMTAHMTRDGNRKFWGQVLVTHPENLGDALLDEDMASARRNSVSHLSLLFRLGNLRGMSRDLILGERWQALKVPTVMLWGERDAFFGGPEKGEAIARKNSHLSVIRLPDAGHIAWIDNPERVVAEIDHFLGNTVDDRLEERSEAGKEAPSSPAPDR
jgi:pimeloyl-ACP methyl ester carboxylesterase